MENPYHPFDPMWHVVEAHLRKLKYQEDVKKIFSFMKSIRKRNMHIIMVTPSLPIDLRLRRNE